jgi:hypothetical protein
VRDRRVGVHARLAQLPDGDGPIGARRRADDDGLHGSGERLADPPAGCDLLGVPRMIFENIIDLVQDFLGEGMRPGEVAHLKPR